MPAMWVATTLLLLALPIASSQSTSSGSSSPDTNTAALPSTFSATAAATAASTTIPNDGGDLLPTGSMATYLSYSSTRTLSGSSSSSAPNITVISSGSTLSTITLTSSPTETFLTGVPKSTISGNTTSTSSASAPTNTQPCNSYPEFCSRSYSNITYVGAHNSPFVNPNNVASNQVYDVTAQLNDGIRMLQGQTHFVNDTIFFCHTTCDLLNVGTAEAFFRNITNWLNANPFEVVTILLGNADFIFVENYTTPITKSGLERYVYTPPKIPMGLGDWPTLGSMILSNKRAVVFMDYMANQDSVPYILDEFSQLWETPFSPTNASFPCDVQRPPGLNEDDARGRMYMANHNLNEEISFLGNEILIPARSVINRTNGVEGFGSLGLTAQQCLAEWNRAPNFLLVDYYNFGSAPGSVFEVAAQQNNVTYSGRCCGMETSGAGRRSLQVVLLGVALMGTLLITVV